MDFFEILRKKVGCEYISDLRRGYANTCAKQILKDINTEDLSIEELLDIAAYIYDENGFKTKEEIQYLFKNL